MLNVVSYLSVVCKGLLSPTFLFLSFHLHINLLQCKMWGPNNKHTCESCQDKRTRKSDCNGMFEAYLVKENMQSFGSIKTHELSIYENNSHLSSTENFEHCSHNIIARPSEDHDSNAQDSRYGDSCNGENGKSVSLASRTRITTSFRCLCSLEEESLDFLDVEPLQKRQFPHGFTELISSPFVPIVRHQEECSPKDTITAFRRSLSSRHANETPNSSLSGTNLFKGGKAKIRIGVRKSLTFEKEEESSIPQARPILQQNCSATEDSIMSAVQKSSTEHSFTELISSPLVPRLSHQGICSPKDTRSRPIFPRSLSLQHANLSPNTSISHTNQFKSGKAKISIGVRKSIIFEEEEESSAPQARPILQQTCSATEDSIMCAVQKSSTEHELIGDFTNKCCLPLTKSRHSDLKAITPATLAQLMNGDFTDSVTSYKIVDCRYPYEFEGGHIYGAVNIYTNEQCLDLLHGKDVPLQTSQKRHVLIFHCEFSQKRGPDMYRYLRKEDRQKNLTMYPSLHYPEIYLLEGGYKNFFEQFSAMCTPMAYKEMLHPEHEDDLRYFRKKSKTWSCDSRQHPRYGRTRRLL